MNKAVLNDAIQTETLAIGQTVSRLKSRLHLRHSLAASPVVAMLLGAGIGWFVLGRKEPPTLPGSDIANWEDEGGAVIALPDPAHLSAHSEGAMRADDGFKPGDAQLGRGVAAFALGIAAAALLPRSAREDALLGPSSEWARRQMAQGTAGAVAVAGQVSRRLADDLVSDVQGEIETKLDAASDAITRTSDAIIAKIKAAGARR